MRRVTAGLRCGGQAMRCGDLIISKDTSSAHRLQLPGPRV